MKIIKELAKMRHPVAMRELEAMRETAERLKNLVQTKVRLQKRISRHGDYKQGLGRERRRVCGSAGYQKPYRRYVMNYKYNVGDIVVLRDKLYLYDAKVAGYRNGMYVLEFAVDHPELKTIRHPFVGGREFRGLYAAEHQIEAVIEHDPVKQIWDDPIAASACEGALPWVEKRFLRKE